MLRTFALAEKCIHVCERLGDAARAGKHNHRNRRLAALHLPHHFCPHPPSEQMVGHDKINRIATKEAQRLVYPGSTEDGVSGMLQNELAEVKPGMFIVNS